MKAKELLSVVLYSYKKKVLSKGFIIMHLAFIGIFLITMGIGIAIGFSIGSSGVTKDSIIVIIDDKDHQDLFKTMIKKNPSFKKYDIKSKAFYDTAVDEVKNKDKQAIIEIIKEGSVPTYNIITNDYSNTNLINEIKGDLLLFNQKLFLLENDIDEGEFYTPQITQGILDPNAQTQGEVQIATIVSMAIIILISIICFPALTVVSNDIIYEKSDRTIELIVSSVSTKNLYISKILVGLMMVLTEVLIIVVFGLIGIGTISAFSQLETFSAILSIINVASLISNILVFGLYVSLMLLLYLLLVIIVSSLTTDIETAGYLLLIPLLPMTIFSYMALSVPYNPSNSPFSLIMTYMPFSSGFALPVKIMYGLTNPTELVISTAILLLTIVVIYLIGQRIFSSNIIKYSFKKKKKLKENKSNSK